MSTSHAFVLALLAVGTACGENVLIGNWELSSLADAGIELPELDAPADAGSNKPYKNADKAHDRAKDKAEEKPPDRASQHSEDSH